MNRIYISLLASILFSSCFLEKKNCDKTTKITLDEDYYLILSKKPEIISKNFNFYCELQGKDLKTQKDTLIKAYNFRWYALISGLSQKGDTLVKKKNSVIVEVRKKDTIYSMEWQCGNPLINGVSFKDFRR